MRRVRDVAQVQGNGIITGALAQSALNLLQVDTRGLDLLDRHFLHTLIDKFQGGPADIESLAASLNEDRGTLEDVVEPYLMQEGFIIRTPRGRQVSALAYEHLGIAG